MTEAENRALTPRADRAFTFTRKRGNATAEFFPGSGAKLRFVSNGTDTLTLPGLPVGTLVKGDSVIVSYLGTTVFRGNVSTRTELHGGGPLDGNDNPLNRIEDVTVEGPWGDMERMVYRQAWAVAGGTTFSTSRVVLNTDPSGNGQSVTAQLKDIANYAKTDCGFQVATTPDSISAGVQILPPDEVRNITCAAAISRTLRFFPKTVCRFDYSTTPPTLHVKIPSAQQASYIAGIDKANRSYTRTSHPVVGVDIATDDLDIDSDGVSMRAFTHQTAGVTDSIDTLRIYLPLEKGGGSSAWESLTVETLSDSASYHTSILFWMANHPALAGVARSEIKEFGPIEPQNKPYPYLTNTTVGDLRRFGKHAEVVRMSCPVTIETADKKERLMLTLDWVCTDATSRTYTRQTGSSSIAGETLPEGLAQAILDQRGGELMAEEMTVRLGDVFPTLGDAVVEGTGANAETLYLQDIDIDCYDLTARLHFGRPSNLSPEDMRDLLLGFRGRAYSTTAPVRDDPEPDDDADDVGGVQPLCSSSTVISSVSKTTIASSGSSSGGKIVLDSADLDSGKEAKIRELTISTSGGKEKKVKVLSTEPEEPEEPDIDDPDYEPDDEDWDEDWEPPEEPDEPEDPDLTDGNDISDDNGGIADDGGYCNSISGGGNDDEAGDGGGNGISQTPCGD